jgi:hypothetical protein
MVRSVLCYQEARGHVFVPLSYRVLIDVSLLTNILGSRIYPKRVHGFLFIVSFCAQYCSPFLYSSGIRNHDVCGTLLITLEFSRNPCEVKVYFVRAGTK